MSTENNDVPDKPKDISSRAQKRRAIPPGNHTEIGSAELVVSGPNAKVKLNKANPQDFIAIYEYTLKQERERATSETITMLGASQGDAEIISKPVRTSAFISYNRADTKYLKELHAHLDYYALNDLINFWDDTKIKPGEKWFDEIKKGLQSAKVAVLLISAEFLAAKFIAAKELPPLLKVASEEGATVLSVILRPCAFKHTMLAQFQAANAPSNPLSMMTRGKRDEVWASVAESIKDALKLPD